MSNHNKRGISPKEFSQEFGMLLSTQEKKRSMRFLSYTKFGGMAMYDRFKIDALLEAHHIDIEY